jgi:hypothetical protein
MKDSEPETELIEAVAEYKGILASVLDQRPSGTRQRLAAALAKNRSFISQISNPTYPTPIPANHIDVIFEICHFSTHTDAQHLKAHTVYLPDLGDEARNEQLHSVVSDFVRQIARVMKQPPKKGGAR